MQGGLRGSGGFPKYGVPLNHPFSMGFSIINQLKLSIADENWIGSMERYVERKEKTPEPGLGDHQETLKRTWP